MRRAAVLGSPIAHSLSPVLHRAAYAALGLRDWRYDAYDVGEDALAGFLDGLGDEWAGLSLTMPLKRAVLPLLDEASEVVRRTGVANTVVLDAGRRHGDNTDVAGIVSALRERGARAAEEAVVLGGGATAASALVALAQLGAAEVALVTRRPASAEELAPVADRAGLRLRPAPWADEREVSSLLRAATVVVATAPAHAADELAHGLAGAAGPDATFGGVLLDVVYAPWPTALAQAWARHGGPVAGGLDLLVHQATHQVRAMLATDPDVGPDRLPAAVALVAPMRRAGLAALAARAGTRGPRSC